MRRGSLQTMKSAANKVTQWFFHHQTLAGYLEPVMQRHLPAWREGAYRASVVSCRQMSQACIELVIRPQASWPRHKAGQHVSLSAEIDGRWMSRVFTLACSPEFYAQTGQLRLTIKTSPQGRFTSAILRVLTSTSWCNISLPAGDFVFPTDGKPVLMLAGGSGITPMIAMLTSHLKDTQAKVDLVYYARVNGHWLVSELAGLAREHPHFRYRLLTRAHDGEVEQHLPLDFKGSLLLCGPYSLTAAATAWAAEHSEIDVRQEFFGLVQPAPQHKSEHRLNLLNTQFQVNNQTNLLAQIEARGIKANRGCGIGICHQCQCTKRSGYVRDVRNGNLSDGGEELIQLCVSQPMSDLELVL